MNTTRNIGGTGEQPLSVLRRLIERDRLKNEGPLCEMCGQGIGDGHPHVANTEKHVLLCTCRGCYLLFTNHAANRGKYRAVPERYLHDPNFTLSEALWESLQIPVRMAFLFQNSTLNRLVAFYPSPAGATESTLPLEAWGRLAEACPMLTTLEPDVEALLIYGGRSTELECHLVPIDACYELSGIVRHNWSGFDGGQQAWSLIDNFFVRIRERSRAVEVQV